MASEETTEIERARAHWHRAANYPADKEAVYAPGHASAQEFDAAKGKLVLEYGCGGGSDAMSYLRRGARVWYADVVHSNVAAAGTRIEAAGLSAQAFPLALKASADLSTLATESFDIVSSHGVLHHIVDPVPVIREFHRILKPTGLFYCMLYTEHLERRFERQIADLILAHRISKSEAFCWLTDERGGPYARSYTVSEGTELLKGCGFRVVKTTDYAKGDFRTFKAERA